MNWDEMLSFIKKVELLYMLFDIKMYAFFQYFHNYNCCLLFKS